jgi:hypothetical protein
MSLRFLVETYLTLRLAGLRGHFPGIINEIGECVWGSIAIAQHSSRPLWQQHRPKHYLQDPPRGKPLDLKLRPPADEALTARPQERSEFPHFD